ncbi:flavin-containing monooxygenase [Nocardioides caldifontis]|uniref:flavin-containing monooxygenase n=1 Tax=Nocardioides caldifontis TaxID=2588938 RepID=UPI001EF0E77E|nr:FAD-dependent oxidoreductase [Nocardioides caldifontis]
MYATRHATSDTESDAPSDYGRTADAGDNTLDVIVIGAGQAGLALAWHLAHQGRRFLVLDAAPELGHTWRNRWDSLRLFSPAQYDSLPGMAFPAAADTYPTKDHVADYLAAYAARFELPVLLGTAVTRLEQQQGRFAVHTTQGVLHARQVVVATGPFQRPVVPTMAGELASGVVQLHSAEYRNPNQIPRGPVVVVGAGNSGLQIAAELAGDHEVTLAVGSTALALPQRLLGRDLFWWLTKLKLLAKTADSRLAKRMQAGGDLVIGSSLKAVRRRGVSIRPRVTGTTRDGMLFADGHREAPTTVIWATGFRSDYSWIQVPGLLADGQVVHQRGVTGVPGLYFLGLTWQHTRGSALLGFVEHDAAWLAAFMHPNASRSSHDTPAQALDRLALR